MYCFIQYTIGVFSSLVCRVWKMEGVSEAGHPSKYRPGTGFCQPDLCIPWWALLMPCRRTQRLLRQPDLADSEPVASPEVKGAVGG